jgi:Flp pilus assembly pilin Flp
MKIGQNLLFALHKDETGQGLVEYLMVLAFVAFAATAGIHSLASRIDSAFDQVAAIVGSYIT